MKYIVDTNVLLLPNSIEEISKYDKFYISSVTIQELENIKTSSKKDDSVKYFARRAVRYLAENQDKYEVIIVKEHHYEIIRDKFLDVTPDNLIIACAYEKSKYIDDLVFVTGDLLCELIARDEFGLNVIKKIEDEKVCNSDYKGFMEIFLDLHDEDDCKFLSKLYKETTINHCELLNNQYLIIKDKHTNEVIDKLKWYGDRLGAIRYKQVSSKFMGKVKPRNIHQELLFDLLQDNNTKIKLTSGCYGSGKDFSMLAHALDMIRQGKYRSLIYIRNNVQVANSKEIGHLPGTAEEKLLPFIMPIADHVGGQFILESMLRDGTIQCQHLGFLRGRSFENCIIYVSEMENMTKEHIQLILGRVAENTIVMMNGDIKQVDGNIFKVNNGMKAMIEKLSGNENFGYVELQRSERSEIARMADLLD